MRKLLVSLAIVAAGATVAVTGAGAGQDRWARAQKDYDALLVGKVAGRPVSCLDTRFLKPALSAYRDKLIYRVDRKLVYVNQTTGGCQNVANGDTLVTRQFQTRLCRGDIAQTVSMPTGVYTGSCAMGDFTPYRTAK